MDDRLTEYTQTYIPSTNPKRPQEIVKTDEFEGLLHQLPDHTTPIQVAATLTGLKIGCITTIPEDLEDEILSNLKQLDISYHKIFDQLLFTRDTRHIETHLQKLQDTELTERYTPLASTEKDIGRFLGVPEDDLLWWENYEDPPSPKEYSDHLDNEPANWNDKDLIHKTGIQLKPQPTKESVEKLIQKARHQKQLAYYLYDNHNITLPIDVLLRNTTEEQNRQN